MRQCPTTRTQNSQSSTEVCEEEIPWNHYTHDYTFKVVPDPNYQYLLSSWNRLTQDVKFTNPDASDALCNLVGATYIGNQTCSFATEETCPDGTKSSTCHHDHMEVEWENASVMRVNSDAANNTRRWVPCPNTPGLPAAIVYGWKGAGSLTAAIPALATTW